MNTLIERRARVTVRVRREDGGREVETSYQFTEHRMGITISQGGSQFGNAKVQIFGVPLDAMNKIARLWLEVLSPSNQDTLAVDVWDGSSFIPFFEGVITWTAINASAAPAVALEIEANDSMVGMNALTTVYAQEGPIALETALAEILAPVNLVVEMSEGLPEFTPSKIHLTGTPMQQASTLLSYYPELAWYVNLQRLIVRPVNGPLGDDPLELDRNTGLIGYPTYSTSGITFAMIFDARVRLGRALDLRTDFDFVNRTKWVAAVLQHQLQPNWPGGQWITQVAAQSYGAKGNEEGSLL